MSVIVAFGLAAAAVGIGFGVAGAISRRTGCPTWRALPTRQRYSIALVMLLSAWVAVFAGWLISEGDAAIGIALLVMVFILPELVLLPVRIRRSRQRAAEARARRLGRR